MLSFAQAAKTQPLQHAGLGVAASAADLLVYQVGSGWGPLCDFLGVEAPSTPFPRTNDREEFFKNFAPA